MAKKKLDTNKIDRLKFMYEVEGKSITEISKLFKISISTVSSYLKV